LRFLKKGEKIRPFFLKKFLIQLTCSSSSGGTLFFSYRASIIFISAPQKHLSISLSGGINGLRESRSKAVELQQHWPSLFASQQRRRNGDDLQPMPFPGLEQLSTRNSGEL